MLKKVKHASGKREIFLFGKKILSYTRRKIIKNRLNQLENELNQFARKYNNLVANQMILQRSDESVILALRQCLMPVPKAKNPQNIIRYLNLVRPFVSPNLKLVRIGGVGDGGYAMACLPEFNAVTPFNATMPFNATPPPPHSTQPSGVKTQEIQPNSAQKHTKNQPKALSLGVSAYSPWDLEMANRGFLVLEFDASIENSPYPNHPNIKFFKQFVGAKDSNENDIQTIAFSRLLKECEFDTNAHNVLQCDIENAEWEILEQCDMSLLARYFSQMTFEFHQCYPDDEAGCEPRFRVLEKIREHFVPIWVHYNSLGGLIVNENLHFCPIMEVSYVRKDLLPKDAKAFAGGLYRLNIDTPNNLQEFDIPVIFP